MGDARPRPARPRPQDGPRPRHRGPQPLPRGGGLPLPGPAEAKALRARLEPILSALLAEYLDEGLKSEISFEELPRALRVSARFSNTERFWEKAFGGSRKERRRRGTRWMRRPRLDRPGPPGPDRTPRLNAGAIRPPHRSVNRRRVPWIRAFAFAPRQPAQLPHPVARKDPLRRGRAPLRVEGDLERPRCGGGRLPGCAAPRRRRGGPRPCARSLERPRDPSPLTPDADLAGKRPVQDLGCGEKSGEGVVALGSGDPPVRRAVRSLRGRPRRRRR